MPFELSWAPLQQKLCDVAGGEFVKNTVGVVIAPVKQDLDIGDHCGPLLLRAIQPGAELAEQRLTNGVIIVVVTGIET